MKRKHTTPVIFIGIQLLCAVIYMLLAKPLGIQDTFMANLAYYLVLFIIPTFIFVARFFKVNPLSYLGFTQNATKGFLIGLAVACFITLVFFITHKFTIDFAFTLQNISLLIGVSLAGILEEIPFRGFYLDVFTKRMGFIKANLLTSALFSILHFNKLLTEGPLQLLILLVFSLWLGYIKKETKSLWSPIVVHIMFNVLTVIF